jgi:YesN/AraC family two-component response regulator
MVLPYSSFRTQATGSTADFRFIIRSRIDQACQLLESTSLSVKPVVAALNYRDEYFFNRQFKAVIGAPPNRWRKLNRV